LEAEVGAVFKSKEDRDKYANSSIFADPRPETAQDEKKDKAAK
jgi:hypothetical protein